MSENGPKATVEWHKVLEPDGLPEGRVTTVTAGLRSCALVHFEGKYAALDNHCPHRVDPWVKARSRTACCAAPGTDSTTTP